MIRLIWLSAETPVSLLDEPVVQLLGPLARQERNDFVSSIGEPLSIPLS